MLPGDSAPLRKARGAFFTPPPVARFVAEWAVRSPRDTVLEPSCGEAAFLHEVGRGGRHEGRLVGVELHAASAAESERTLRAEGIEAAIRVADFFQVEPDGAYDAVVGNPPYVRYQDFSGEVRVRSRAAALRAGVSLTGLASSWAAFTVHSALFLKQRGRLGLVLPAELLTVNYAADVRRFLMQHFRSVSLVVFAERVFPGVQEDVVLLLAEGFDPTGAAGTDHCEVFQVRDAAALSDSLPATRWTPATTSGKWSGLIVSSGAGTVYARATTCAGFTELQNWGATTLGMVTGNNKFFALSPERVAGLGLARDDLVALSPPGSRHLRGLSFTDHARAKLGGDGSATWLFRPSGDPSAAARRYIASGERTGVDLAYKCRVRKPWWRVPYLPPADLLLTYMNADTPRITTNRARAHHVNSVHGIYLHAETRTDGMGYLPIAALNSVTLLGAEIVGRAYGGGVLKIEPREADHWPVPSTQLVHQYRDELAALKAPVAARLRQGSVVDAARLVDEVLLNRGLGLSVEEVRALRSAHVDLRARRAGRGRKAEPRG